MPPACAIPGNESAGTAQGTGRPGSSPAGPFLFPFAVIRLECAKSGDSLEELHLPNRQCCRVARPRNGLASEGGHGPAGRELPAHFISHAPRIAPFAPGTPARPTDG